MGGFQTKGTVENVDTKTGGKGNTQQSKTTNISIINLFLRCSASELCGIGVVGLRKFIVLNYKSLASIDNSLASHGKSVVLSSRLIVLLRKSVKCFVD